MLLEMAHKTKTTLTRTAHEKIKRENAWRVREVRDRTTKKANKKDGHDRESEKERVDGGEEREGQSQECSQGVESP